MSVSNVSAATPSSGQNTTSITSSTLGKSDFLKLLIAQLKNQNPMSPADNTQFVSQMAQFSSLEQMQNLNTSMSQLLALQLYNSDNNTLLYAVSMLGKNVEATDPDTETAYSGQVQSYRIKDNEVYFVVDGAEIPSSWISNVSIAEADTTANTEAG